MGHPKDTPSFMRRIGAVLVLLFAFSTLAGWLINTLDEQRDPYMSPSFLMVSPWVYWSPLAIGCALWLAGHMLARRK